MYIHAYGTQMYDFMAFLAEKPESRNWTKDPTFITITIRIKRKLHETAVYSKD